MSSSDTASYSSRSSTPHPGGEAATAAVNRPDLLGNLSTKRSCQLTGLHAIDDALDADVSGNFQLFQVSINEREKLNVTVSENDTLYVRILFIHLNSNLCVFPIYFSILTSGLVIHRNLATPDIRIYIYTYTSIPTYIHICILLYTFSGILKRAKPLPILPGTCLVFIKEIAFILHPAEYDQLQLIA